MIDCRHKFDYVERFDILQCSECGKTEKEAQLEAARLEVKKLQARIKLREAQLVVAKDVEQNLASDLNTLRVEVQGLLGDHRIKHKDLPVYMVGVDRIHALERAMKSIEEGGG